MSLVGHRIIIKAVNLKIIAACVYACITTHARSQESSSSVDVCREKRALTMTTATTRKTSSENIETVEQL